MNKVIKKLQDKTGDVGELVISTGVILMIVFALLVLAITFFGAISKVNKINFIAQEIVRIAEIKGHTGLDSEIAQIQQGSGIDDTEIYVTGNYITGSNKIQLGGAITVTVKSSATVGIGNIATVKIPIMAKAVGKSEQYWK